MYEQVLEHMKHVVIQNGAVLFSNVRLGKDVVIFPGAVVGRPPLSTGATFHLPDTSVLLPVDIGDGCVIGCNAVIYMGVKIGPLSMVGDRALIREGCEVGHHSLVAGGAALGINVKVGDRVRIMDGSMIAGNALVEDYVFIAHQVATANALWIDRKEPDERTWTERGVTIRRFASIGMGVLILPGVEIGENAMVGAGAVVTKDVRPGVLVAGVPARVVRTLGEDELKHGA